MNDKRIWITWEKQRRNQSMSKALGAKLFELICSQRGLSRYSFLSRKTISVIRSEKPDTVFVQNPSIVLSLLAIILKPFFRYVLIIDEHNAGIYPAEGRSCFLNFVARFIARKANLILVTNQNLSALCSSWGALPMVFPDPLPKFDLQGKPNDYLSDSDPDTRPIKFACICTWAEDEPVEEVIEAARRFSNREICVRLTGNSNGKLAHVKIPESVEILGFLSDEEYASVIFDSDAVIVLTKRQDCLNCGAYEAVAAERPGILSDTEVLKFYFNKGFVFVSNSSEGIAQGIETLKENRSALAKGVSQLKSELLSCSEQYAAFLDHYIESNFYFDRKH